jgi:HD-like signal output (HDOD) protein
MQDIQDLLAEIDQLSESGQAELDRLIDRSNELKQLPLVARKIMQVIENPKSTAGDLEKVIQSDQALTLKILKIANSSFYGLLRKVNTLQRAILVVGFKAIKDIAVSTAILNMYRTSDPHSVKLWENAIGVGIATRMLSLEFEKTDVEEAFVAGLLHNIGKTLMLRNYPKETKEIYARVLADPAIDELALEKQVFGFAHTHAGGTLAKNWNLSPSLEATLRYYPFFKEASWTELDISIKLSIALVSVSTRICRYLGIGYERPLTDFNPWDCPEIEFLDLGEERLNEMLEQVKLTYYAESQFFV